MAVVLSPGDFCAKNRRRLQHSVARISYLLGRQCERYRLIIVFLLRRKDSRILNSIETVFHDFVESQKPVTRCVARDDPFTVSAGKLFGFQ